MRIGLDVSSMQHFRWRDYAVRFVFGGIVTALAGLIARRYGPGVAGLFLAFPAIFPAGAILIEKQEREKKRRAGLDGTSRGRAAALCANMSETSSPSTITVGRGKKSHFDKHSQDEYFFRCVGSGRSTRLVFAYQSEISSPALQ